MNVQRIVFTEPNVARLEQHELEAPSRGEVQVKLAVSTISSGTERANLIGDPNISIAPITDTPPAVVFPRISGYSSSGTVTAVGEGVDNIKIGDRVAMSWTTHSQYININSKTITSFF